MTYIRVREGDHFVIKKFTPEELDQYSEDNLLSKINKFQEGDDEVELEKATYELARFYQKYKRFDKAIKVFQNLSKLSDKKNRLGFYLFSLGQLHENINDFSTAIVYYQKSLNLLPESEQHFRYFIFNNIGYCHNILNDFIKGEDYCRQAIDINSKKCNAYKNLGISLEGQGRYSDAVEMYLEATCTNVTDRRAMDLLMDLIFKHPEIKGEIQDLDQKIENCLKTPPPPTYFSDALAYPMEWWLFNS
jgi:tetratricopeptide (TPR) repeat protein